MLHILIKFAVIHLQLMSNNVNNSGICPKADGKLDSFSDAASVSTYAADAMQWAVANGIVNGSNGKLNPQDNATCAEVAAILMRFCEMSK